MWIYGEKGCISVDERGLRVGSLEGLVTKQQWAPKETFDIKTTGGFVALQQPSTA